MLMLPQCAQVVLVVLSGDLRVKRVKTFGRLMICMMRPGSSPAKLLVIVVEGAFHCRSTQFRTTLIVLHNVFMWRLLNLIVCNLVPRALQKAHQLREECR